MKEVIVDPKSPASTSPVSQGTSGGGFVFVGGQMPRDMESGKIVAGAAAQARLSLKHCISVLEAGGSSADKIMLTFVYMTDLSANGAVNDAFADVFGDSPPARNLVEVSDIGEDAIVEIGVIALE